jgi:predicted transcriptional regulator
MKTNPFIALIFSCLLVTSMMMPVHAFPGSPGNRNRSAGSPDPGLWSNNYGDRFELWFDDNKTLQCAGLNNKGQCDIPAEVQGAKSVKVGQDFGVAHINKSTIVTWGANDYGQQNVPSGLENIHKITTTSHSIAALLKNGTVIAWGKNDKGQTDVPPILVNNVSVVKGGKDYFVVITREGNVVAWGDNSLGQGNVPAGMEKIVTIKRGDYHTVALSENGTAYAWGWNGEGQCDIPKNIGKVLEIGAAMDYTLLHLENRSILVIGSPPAGTPGPGLYPSINLTHFSNNDDLGKENELSAVTDDGEELAWVKHCQYLDHPNPDLPDITFLVSNTGIFNLKRVCDKSVLDHRNRSLIYETISANPGIHFNDLCRALEINRGTLSYHLAVLLSSGKVVGMEYAGKTVYFSRKGCFEDTERKLITHLKNPARMRLLHNLYTHGSLQRVDLIDKTRLSRAAATWHLKSLTDEGIVQVTRTGRKAYYSLHPEISLHMPGQVAAGPGAVGCGDWSTVGESGRVSPASVS